MIFNHPLPFEEAIESRRAKALLPTSLSSRELDALAPELREQAFFSARTNSLSHLSRMDSIIEKMINPTGERGDSWDASRARIAIRESLQQIGYDPADINAVPGSLKDLGSEKRINLILDTNVKMARGYGNWAQGQDAAVLDEWPGSELVRHEGRNQERTDWPKRFLAAGGTLHGGGRMIALKDSPVWTKLSRFSLPYAPFDFNSGMGLDDVDRDTCIKLGLIDRDQQIEPQERPFHENPPIEGTPEIITAAAKSLGPRYGVEAKALVKFSWKALTAAERIEAGNIAIRRAIATKSDVIDAAWREDTGPIDFRWGDDERGLQHIIKRRSAQYAAKGGPTAQQVLDKVPEVITLGELTVESDRDMKIIHDGWKVVLTQTWDKKPSARWVFNAYDIDPAKAGRKKGR